MAIADSKALLADIMNIIDDHVTAKASRQLEQQIMDVLDGYQIATMIRDDAGDADNSRQLIDAFINAKTAEGLAKSSLYLYRNRLTRLYEDTGVHFKMDGNAVCAEDIRQAKRTTAPTAVQT